nr:hypothetical protein FFPRI1PSEUD_41210 [Pseudomonas sp. FFPRI_1]
MSNEATSAIFHKIVFSLEQDADGYPPYSHESLWGIKEGDDTYIIDNTPNYLYGLSKGDLVKVRVENQELIGATIIKQGGHSTLRVFAGTPQAKTAIAGKLRQLGASCILTQGLSLFSVNIPPDCSFEAIDTYLAALADGDNIAYEDACLQHEGIDFERQSECASLASLRRLTH